MLGFDRVELRTEGEDLVLALNFRNEDTTPEAVLVTLVLHDDISVDTFNTIRCERKGISWEGRLSCWRPAAKPCVLEIARVTDARGQPVNTLGTYLFMAPVGDGIWGMGAVAQAERDRLQKSRAARFDAPLAAAGAKATDPIFTVVMLVENLYLTRQQRIPGMRVLPIAQTGLGADVGNVLNAALQHFGFGSFIDIDSWVEEMRRRRPAAILYVPKVQAVDGGAARLVCRSTAHQLLDLLALRRKDSPRLLAGVVGLADEQGVIQSVNAWNEGVGYTGDVLGGSLSGEDPRGLMLFWDGLLKEPRARLWLSLYADAIADQSWDYRLFRCFNLLEGVATEIVPDGKNILDDQGNPRLLDNGKPYTTKQARGKVYELLRMVAARNQLAESCFTAGRVNGAPVELWDDVGLWVAVRNAVAHRGSWALPEGDAPQRAQMLVEAEITSRGHENTFASGVWHVVQAIRTAVESTLFAALRGRL